MRNLAGRNRGVHGAPSSGRPRRATSACTCAATSARRFRWRSAAFADRGRRPARLVADRVAKRVASRTLEAAGHFVVFVDIIRARPCELCKRRDPMLDLFYLAIGVVGFLALWGITKACDRV